MRSLHRPIIVIALASFAVSIPAVTAPADGLRTGRTSPSGTVDWPQARFSPVHHGVNPLETILSPSTVGGLRQLWTAPLSGQVLLGTPTVVDGTVYLGDYLDTKGIVHAFDALTGTPLWSTQVEGGLEDAPAVVNGVVYVHTNAGIVYALTASTGSIVWSATVGHAVSPVTVVNGIVYANGFDQLVALDAATGTQLWTASLRGLSDSAPTVAGGRVFVVVGAGFVQAFDATSGSALWVSRPSTSNNFQLSTPAASGRLIFVGSSNRGAVYALDAGTGKIVWKDQLDGIMDSSAAVANGVVYIGGYNNTYALNSRTGAVIWTAPQGTIGMGVTFANGIVYSVSDQLYALDAADGSVLASQSFSPRFSYSSPVVVNGMVFAGADDVFGTSALYAFGL